MPYAYVNGIKIHYDTSGEGAPLVLLHGLGSSCQDWLLQTQVFSKSYTVITPDSRGHGDSDKPTGPYSIGLFANDVVALLDSLGVAQVHLLGISMGGLVAQQLVLDRPQRVKSLVLVNTFSHLNLNGTRARVTLLRRILILQFFSMKRIGHFVASQLFPKPEQEAMRQVAAERWAGNEKNAYRAASKAIWRFNVTDRLDEIYCPTLIIAGEHDRTVSAPHREVLHQSIVGSQLVVIPDSTHATPVDQPQAFNQAVLDFLASVPE